MANEQVSSRGEQLSADFGTLRSTFLEQDTQSLEFAGEKFNVADISRRAITAMDNQMVSEQYFHKARMANMQLKYMKDQASDNFATSMIQQGFGLAGNVSRGFRNKSQLEEMKIAMGLTSGDPNVALDNSSLGEPDYEDIYKGGGF